MKKKQGRKAFKSFYETKGRFDGDFHGKEGVGDKKIIRNLSSMNKQYKIKERKERIR